MPKNPSEAERLKEEYDHAFDMSYKLTLSKSDRERYLADLRRIEKEMGIDSVSYNGRP